MKKQEKNFLRGAGVLAVCAVIVKVIGALYRIPLTNVLGAEGIGLYQMVFPLYTVLLTVSSGGLPVAISKSVAARDETGGRRVLRVAMVSLAAAGGVATLAVLALHRVIAAAQGNPAAAPAYLGIAPSLLLVCAVSGLRGYFQGRQNMLPTAFSQLVEQLVKLVLGLWFARLLMPYGVAYGVLGSVLGVSLSEAAALLYLAVRYAVERRLAGKHAQPSAAVPSGAEGEFSAELAAVGVAETLAAAQPVTLPAVEAALPQRRVKRGDGETKKLLKEIYRVAIPVTLGALVLPLTQVIDSLLVVNLLMRTGNDLRLSTALYGLVTGPVNSLINMPTVVTLALSGALLPKISNLFAEGRPLDGPIRKAVRVSLWAGGAFSAGLLVCGGFALRVLYASGLGGDELALAGALLRVGAVGVFYVSVLQVATAVLQGCDRAHVPAVNLLIGAACKVVLTVILLPTVGIAGAVAASTACYAVTCLLDVIALRRTLRRHAKLLP